MPDIKELTCQHCHALNRIPAKRLADKPKCGRCKNMLFMGVPVELDESSLPVFLAKNKLPLLIDFWAPWCGPCVNMAPAFAEAAKLLEPNMILGKVNTQIHTTLAAQNGIRSLPTLIVFAEGKELARHMGALDTPAIAQWVKAQLPVSA